MFLPGRRFTSKSNEPGQKDSEHSLGIKQKSKWSSLDRTMLQQAAIASGIIPYQWNIRKDHFKAEKSTYQLLPILEKLKTSRDFHKCIEPSDLALRLDCLSEHIRFNTSFICEYRIILPDGSRRWLLESGQATFTRDRTPLKLFGTLQDITPLKQQEKSYGKLAIFDDLTGAYSMFRLKEMLEHALAYSRRYENSGAFAIIDVQNLKKVNRQYGHEVGDVVIASVTHRLRTHLRSADTLGRLDGDMMGIVLSCCKQENAEIAFRRLMNIVTAEPVTVNDHKIKVQLNIGVVRFPKIADTVPDAWQYAEVALEHAKQASRQLKKADKNQCTNSLVMYEDTRHKSSSVNYTKHVEEMLQDALENDGFMLVFQPILDMEPGKEVVDPIYECLLRLKKPQDNIKGPADFIPIAEKTELMWQVDATVLKLVCRELRRHNGMTLAFNISARTAGNPRWMHLLRQQIKLDPTIAYRMIIEITETTAIGLTSNTIDFIEQLRGYGCMVALDDFGAGYTTFRQLKLLPLDYIKIDGDMVRSFEYNYHNKLFIRTILDLAQAFNLKVIAEGIETPQQRDLLTAEGVSLMQGYLFAKPSTNVPWR